MLALPADAGSLGERLFHHRSGIDEQLDLAVQRLVHPARHRAQLLPHHVVVVAPLGVDRDRAPVAPFERRQRIGGRAVILAHHDRGFRLRPEPRDVAPPLLVGGEPAHVAVMTGLDEAGEVPLRPRAQRRLAEPHGVEPLGERALADPFAERDAGQGAANSASVPASIASRSPAIRSWYRWILWVVSKMGPSISFARNKWCR